MISQGLLFLLLCCTVFKFVLSICKLCISCVPLPIPIPSFVIGDGKLIELLPVLVEISSHLSKLDRIFLSFFLLSPARFRTGLGPLLIFTNYIFIYLIYENSKILSFGIFF